VGLGEGLVQGTAPSTHTPGTDDPNPAACRPFPLPVNSVCAFILGEVVVGHSHCHVWLEAQDVLGPLYGFS
jgi:hypothetical protein